MANLDRAGTAATETADPRTCGLKDVRFGKPWVRRVVIGASVNNLLLEARHHVFLLGVTCLEFTLHETMPEFPKMRICWVLRCLMDYRCHKVSQNGNSSAVELHFVGDHSQCMLQVLDEFSIHDPHLNIISAAQPLTNRVYVARPRKPETHNAFKRGV